MKVEIKEIKINKANGSITFINNGIVFSQFGIAKEILDLITNLQKENERLKEIVENLTTMTVCGDKKQIKNTVQYKLDIYKSRIEKAIEYIEKSMDNPQPFYKYLFGDENGKVENLDRLLNILQGVGKDE